MYLKALLKNKIPCNKKIMLGRQKNLLSTSQRNLDCLKSASPHQVMAATV